MALDNVGSILRVGSFVSSWKLLLMQGSESRPNFRGLLLALLRPFVKDGRVAVRYRCYGRELTSFVRMSELSSDYMSTRELAVADAYRLDCGFYPDFVVDGGGNIGLFTLRAAACMQAVGNLNVDYVICEPVPDNLDQIHAHLAVNGAKARILPVCLGGTARTIPFYCREANQSSFDSAKPYARVMEIPVVPLRDVIAADARRILIKLDIEGMEVEALAAFLPGEDRAVYVVGELHDFAINAPRMRELFEAHGWTLELLGIADDLCSFRGCSPAAAPMLEWTGAKPGADAA